jgi:hypothetical protein
MGDGQAPDTSSTAVVRVAAEADVIGSDGLPHAVSGRGAA